MRRALEYAAGARRHARPALRGRRRSSAGGHMHEGEWSCRLGIPGQPAEAEELMVLRDIALARLTGATVHFQHLSTAGSVALVRAAKAEGLPVTAEATPHHFTLTHADVRRLRPGVQGEPAAAHRRRRRRGARPAWPTAPSTPSPPTTRRTRRSQGAAVRPGAARACSASRRRWRWRSPSSTCRSTEVLALLSWQPARIAGARRRPRRADRAGPPGQPLRARPGRHLDRRARRRWPAAARNTPYAGRTLTRPGPPHASSRGEPVVVDGEAQR